MEEPDPKLRQQLASAQELFGNKDYGACRKYPTF
jgi:hypothetical protein